MRTHARLSPYSQIALYLECPLLYKRRYIDVERMEATPAAWQGAADEQRIIYGEREDFTSLLGLGLEMLKVFARQALPQHVLAVEAPFEFRLEHPRTGEESSVPLRGVIDLIEEDEEGTLWVVDHKTASRAYSEAQLSGYLQMLIYAAAVKQLDMVEGREVKLRLDVLLKKSRSTLLQYPLYRDDQDIARLLEIVEGVWRAIEAEAFYPRCGLSTRFGRVHEECGRRIAVQHHRNINLAFL